MSFSKLLESDLKKISEVFPKLNAIWNAQFKIWLLRGDLDICDNAGDYWGTYQITILIPKGYPHCVPLVREDSAKIPREDYRHISKDGDCCLDIDHRLLHMSKKGISIVDFIKQKVYPYFANQLYYDKHNHFAGEEYAHHFEGIKQFYRESLNLVNHDSIVSTLEFLLSGKKAERNIICPCRSKKKLKYCHLESIEFLFALGKERLLVDLDLFKKNSNDF
jgi:hypothetical protein